MTATLLGVCGCQSSKAPEAPSPEIFPAVSQAKTPGGTHIYALRTGWVNVKKNHRDLKVPSWWVLPAIFFGEWADWMPIISYVVVHPEMTLLVDTGPERAILQKNYYDCDPNAAFFYTRNLRFSVPPGDTLKERLQEIGMAPEQIDRVLITHFHADHVGGLKDVAHARVSTGSGNWPGHVGAFTCRLPAGFSPELLNFPEPFAESEALTTDGALHFISLPGHTPGHVGLSLKEGQKRWLMVGDATFDAVQSASGNVAGVSEDMAQAREVQKKLHLAFEDPDTLVLPAHDVSVFERLVQF